MQYHNKRFLRPLLAGLAVLGVASIAACSQPQATPTPGRDYNCDDATYNTTLKPGGGFGFFPGYTLKTDIREIIYKGEQGFVFLDSKGNVKRPPEIPANPDGSVRMRKGGAIRSTAVDPATGKLYRATFIIEGFAEGNAIIEVREEECTPSKSPAQTL